MLMVEPEMVEPEFARFQMQIEGVLGNAVELCQPRFSKAPEGFDAIDVMLSHGERVVSVVAPEMLVKAPERFFLTHAGSR